MRVLRVAFMAAVISGALWSAPAQAAVAPIADWQLNEESGPVMVDASGNGLDGSIGSDVLVHQATPSGYGYRFLGDGRVVNHERLVTLADDARLDPGTDTYAVTISFKTGALDPNILQKGQAGQTGGYWKLALQHGWPRCHFRDAAGRTKAIGFVNDPRPETKVADGAWHTLRCELSTTGVKLTIDYGEPTAISKFISGTIGVIDNTRPLAIGGKYDCDAITVGCDYFAGLIDSITIERP